MGITQDPRFKEFQRLCNEGWSLSLAMRISGLTGVREREEVKARKALADLEEEEK